MEIIKLITPCPKACITEIMIISKPARRKERLMIRRAGMPMASICSDALKMPRSCFVKAHGFHQAIGLSCAVVEADDRHHAVIQTEYRHEDEALQLEVYAEYGCCG